MPFKGGTGNLGEHQNAESTISPNDTEETTDNSRYRTISAGYGVCNCTITTTKRSLIVVVAAIYSKGSASGFEIYRGTNKTKEKNASTADSGGFIMTVLYATEVLNAGSYVYDLVNWGADAYVHGACIKAVAVSL